MKHDASEDEEKVTLVTFIGAGKYDATRYSWGEGTTAQEERYVQAAIVDLLGGRCRDVVVLATDDAKRKHADALRKRLDELGASLTVVDIASGRAETELWANFNALGKVLDGLGRVLLDITHGFRSLPVTALLAVQFFRRLSDFRIDGLVYGAFEKKEAEKGLATPIFDLTPMLDLTSWAESWATWKDTGRADAFTRMGDKREKSIRKTVYSQGEDAGSGLREAIGHLRGLIVQLEGLDGALRLVRPDEVVERANLTRKSIEELLSRDGGLGNESAGELAPLSPIMAAADALKKDLEPLTSSGSSIEGEPSGSSPETLTAVARWMARRGRVAEAYTLLREAVVSSCVRALVLTGHDSLMPEGERDEYSSSERQFREAVAKAFMVHANGQSLTEDSLPWRRDLHRLLDSNSTILDRYWEASNAIRDDRNRINHAWQSDDHRKSKHGSRSAADSAERAERACDAVLGFAESIEASREASR